MKNNTRNRLASMVTALALTVGMFSVSAFAADKPDTVIKIFHTNDVHARYDASIGDSDALKGFGYSRLKTIISQNSADANDVLLFDAGDTFHGQSFATLNEGDSIARVMSAVGYDAMVAGNHDFNYGSARTAQLAAIANTTLLGANVKHRNGLLATGFKEYMIFESEGVRIGVFGLSTPESAYKTSPKNVSTLRFADPVATAQTIVDTLHKTEKVDVVVCLAHLGIDPSSGKNTSVSVAQNVKGIDLLIDGHSHTTIDQYPPIDGTVLTSTGEYMGSIGMATVTVSGDAKKTVSVKADTFKASDYTSAGLPANKGIQTVIDNIKTQQAPLLEKKIASTPVLLDGERENARTGDTNLSRLITAAMLNETGADIALTNGGGIRASIPAGDITVGQVQTVLPFGNYIVTVKLTGKEVKEAIEHGLPGLVDGKIELIGSCAQFAGLEVTYDAKAARGTRITSITHNAQPLDDAKEYIVATNDFMSIGGDAYTMLKKPIVNEFAALDEALIRYINRVGRAGIIKINEQDLLKLA